MSDDEMRVAILAKIGWKRLKTWCGYEWQDPQGRKGYQEAAVDGRDSHYVRPPDPLNDLNAMHEAEKVLGARDWKYVEELKKFSDGSYSYSWTARQRAEAFLRTLHPEKFNH